MEDSPKNQTLSTVYSSLAGNSRKKNCTTQIAEAGIAAVGLVFLKLQNAQVASCSLSAAKVLLGGTGLWGLALLVELPVGPGQCTLAVD